MPVVKSIAVKDGDKWLQEGYVVELNEKESQVAENLKLSPKRVKKAGALGIVRDTIVIQVSSKEEGNRIKKLIKENIPPT
jgi:hypothetical protein